MQLHRLAVLPLAGALVLGPVLATPAFAAHSTRHAAVHAHEVHRHASARRALPFTVVGTLSAVDTSAGTVTVAVRSGTRDLRGQSVTATVTATARILVADVPVTLADLSVGSAVTVSGTRAGGVLTATRVLGH
ncbi:MAG: hypothetical protein AUI14_06470 [Actinobacteria bacterium 13_2_20CM_2_71_6]|nr:MAG: hypothetical protein AUI14_06470 [Actinobacteria bacterium 13_2_20CM_2_71_6]